MNLDKDTIELLTQFFILINTVAVVPLFKFIFFALKEISYIKGHLGLK